MQRQGLEIQDLEIRKDTNIDIGMDLDRYF